MFDTTKFTNMVFENPTTYTADYLRPVLSSAASSKYQEKPRPTRPSALPLKDTHTLTDWKSQAIPFNLLHRPRPILGTHPRAIQKKYEMVHIDEEERSRVIRSRPRLVVPPAVSLDDVADARARGLLCRDMYTSDVTHHQRQALAKIARASVRAPFATHPAPSNPIRLPPLQAPLVPAEWRMESVQWDRRQLRAHCDATQQFWDQYKPPACRACEESSTVAAYRKMQQRNI